MNPKLERARAEAARAIHDRYEQMTHWVKTLGKTPRPLETSGIKDVHRLDANAAIDAFLAAARADEGLVERVAGLIHDICSPDYPWKTFASLNPELADRRRNAARAAIAAMWDRAPEVSNDAG